MPTAIDQGDALEIIAQFYDANGIVVAVPTAIATVTYTSISGSSGAQALPMSPRGYSLTATWPSSVAAVNTMATISIMSPVGSVAVSGDPLLRICMGL